MSFEIQETIDVVTRFVARFQATLVNFEYLSTVDFLGVDVHVNSA